MFPKGLGLKLGLKGRGPVEKVYEQMKREEISKVFQGPCSIIQLGWKRDCSEGDAGTQLEQASHARN